MEGKSASKVDRRYELLEPLGRGGMGAVYLAKDLLTGKQVALKQVTVPAEDLIAGGLGQEARTDYNLILAQEFQALATLRHPHIISVYDFGFDRSKKPYFTMEFLKDGRDILTYGQNLPMERKVDLIVQVLQALVYLHRRGILHRDLKPANAMIVDDQVKLLDFGLSVITSRSIGCPSRYDSWSTWYRALTVCVGTPVSVNAGAGQVRAAPMASIAILRLPSVLFLNPTGNAVPGNESLTTM